MRRRPGLCLTIVVSLATVGCSGGTDSGPFGASEQSPLLLPYAGDWRFELDKTISLWKEAGVPDEQLDVLRQLSTLNPQLGSLHPDLTIEGNTAVGEGIPESEYRFFAIHEHDGKACGKAWHHEDRHDPGDMSKCYARLSTDNGDLHLELRMQEQQVDPDDPDLRTSPATEGGSAAECTADNPPDSNWSEWRTYVFSPK